MGKAKYRSAEADKHKVSLAAASGPRWTCKPAEYKQPVIVFMTRREKSLTHFQTHSRKSIDNAITDEPW